MRSKKWMARQVKKVPFERWFHDDFGYARNGLPYKLWAWIFRRQLSINSLVAELTQARIDHKHYENRYHKLLQQRSLECEGTELDWSPVKARCGILTLGTSNAPRNINR